MSGDIFSLTNSSGWNNSLSGNGGRTGVSDLFIRLDQYGQGDLNGIGVFGVVASTRAGATSYLAEPAIECFGGELFGGGAGQYIEFDGDNDINDNGFDIAAVYALLTCLYARRPTRDWERTGPTKLFNPPEHPPSTRWRRSRVRWLAG